MTLQAHAYFFPVIIRYFWNIVVVVLHLNECKPSNIRKKVSYITIGKLLCTPEV